MLSTLNIDDEQAAGCGLRVLHCVYREGLASVFASQVLKPVRALREAGVDVGLVTMQPVGEWLRRPLRQRWAHQRRAIREAIGDDGAFTRLPSPPARWRAIWDDRRVFDAWYRRMGSGYGIVHCRDAAMTNIATDARRRTGSQAQVIYDCRGADHAEHVYNHGFSDEASLPVHLQREWDRRRDAIARAMRGADAVVCVSEVMADFLREEFDARDTPMVVCPCAVETAAFAGAEAQAVKLRNDLRLSDRFVVVYCGSVRSWQLPEQSVRMFRRLQRLEPSAFFLVVTPHPQPMQEMLDRMGVTERDRHVTAASHDQVPGYLAAGDVGLLLREPCLVNRVASPVKFAEYLAAGLPVVLTEQIGDYSALVAEARVGCVVPYAKLDSDDDEPLASFVAEVGATRQAWRERCRAVTRENLSLQQHRDRLLGLYRSLGGGGNDR